MQSLVHIKNSLQELKLFGVLNALESAMQGVTRGETSPSDLLAELLQAEKDCRHEKLVAGRIKNSRLKGKPTLEDFDFTAQRSLNRTVIKELYKLSWLGQGRPLLVIGPTGVGKTFISQALGHQACCHKYTVLFTTFSDYLENQSLARSAGGYLKFRMRMTKPDLLIMDDFGLRKLTAQEAHDLNDLLKERCGRSVIINTQLPIENWTEVIEDPVIADTIIDQLIHSSIKIIFKKEDETYRKVLSKKLGQV